MSAESSKIGSDAADDVKPAAVVSAAAAPATTVAAGISTSAAASQASSAWAPPEVIQLASTRDRPRPRTAASSRSSADHPHRHAETRSASSNVRSTSSKNNPHKTPRDAQSGSENNPDHDTDHDDQPMSLQDRLAATALAGTIELLKIAGGVTLSTTGKLAAPPLHVTRTILLPSLWAALMDYLTQTTPTRVKDWFRILSSSVHHFFSVLENTPQGQDFQKHLVTVLADLIYCLSADTSRQVLMDWTACFVKFADILTSPQVLVFSQQWSIFACRLLQAASTGRNQQLVHHVQEALISAGQLAADPSTTLALAEVTAYLVYALEMEDAEWGRRPGTASLGTVQQQQLQQQEKQQEQRAERRHERNQYQQRTYVDRVSLQQPSTAVEDAILSSFGMLPSTGVAAAAAGDNDKDDDLDNRSVPSRIEVTEHAPWREGPASLRDKVTNPPNVTGAASFHEKARNDINIDYLRQQILGTTARRKEGLEDQDMSTVGDSGDLEDLRVVASEQNDAPTLSRRVVPSVRVSYNDNYPDQVEASALIDENEDEGEPVSVPPPRRPRQIPDPLPLQGETSVQHFYRVLDEILHQKRREAVQSAILADADAQRNRHCEFVKDNGLGVAAHVHIRGRRGGSDSSVKRQLSAIRSDIMAARPVDDPEAIRRRQMRQLVQRYKKYLLLGLITLSLVALLWTAFGLYGIYVFLYPPPPRTMPPPAAAGNLQPSLRRPWRMGSIWPLSWLPASQPAVPSTSSPPLPQEIVVRVVRQVVYVDSSTAGKDVGKRVTPPSPSSTHNEVLSSDQADRLARCMAEAWE